METIKSFYAFVNEITISKWSNKENGLNAKVGGNCRLYCTDVKLNPFTGEPILDKDGNPKAGMRSLVIECPLRNIHNWADTLIASATAEGVSLKDAILKTNSEVYHLAVSNVVLNPIERVISVTEVTDVTSDKYIAVEYNKDLRAIRPVKKDNGGFYETSTIHYFASDDLGISKEVAERHWHSSWATAEEILERCARLSTRTAANAAPDAEESGEDA